MMTENQLLTYCQEALAKLGSRGTNISIKNLGRDILGLTIYKPFRRPTIEINQNLRYESHQVINTIIAHEYAHVVAGEAAGHNKQWYAIANKFSKQLGGSTVTRNVVDELNLSKKFWMTNFDYVYCCQTCGKIIGFNDIEYSTLSSSITHNHCGGSWIKLK